MFVKKVTPEYIENEIKLHKIFERLNIEKYFLKPSRSEHNKLYFKKLDHDFHSYYKTVKNKHRFWLKFLTEISYVISVLEKHHIQHNDLHFGNIMFDKNQLKIIDLETMTDYKTVKPRFSPEDRQRMGFSDKFHIGADLNQLLGYVMEEYKDEVPIKFEVIKLDKEFPYAIDFRNPKTSGNKIQKMIQSKSQ
jgi:hypothetical protein